MWNQLLCLLSVERNVIWDINGIQEVTSSTLVSSTSNPVGNHRWGFCFSGGWFWAVTFCGPLFVDHKHNGQDKRVGEACWCSIADQTLRLVAKLRSLVAKLRSLVAKLRSLVAKLRSLVAKLRSPVAKLRSLEYELGLLR